MLRTEADDIGGGDVLLIVHMLKNMEARRLTPRCRRGYTATWLLRLHFVLLFILFCFNAVFTPGYPLRLVHGYSPLENMVTLRLRDRFQGRSRLYRRFRRHHRNIRRRCQARPRPRDRSAACYP